LQLLLKKYSFFKKIFILLNIPFVFCVFGLENRKNKNKRRTQTMKSACKILSLALALVFCLGCFAACGGGAGDKTIIIGGSGPLTGANSQYGDAVLKGAQLAVDEINAAGGYNGYTFKLQMIQDDCDAVKAENAYNSLFDMDMKVSIGSVTSGSAKAFATAAKDDGIFCLTPSASADDVIGVGNHSFRVCFGDPQQGVIAADELVTNKGFTKIGVVYDTSDTYSTGLYQAFAERMAELNKVEGTDYIVRTFTAESKVNFDQQVTDMKTFTGWIWNKIERGQRGTLPNGILYLKGGDLAEELALTGKRWDLYSISDLYDEDFFDTKQVVYTKR
jgi:branched-chain amino acid transport system substrate-binding protein